ncbi:helix-turn-helix domain-containing protein [Streptomyces sp. NPDC051658]|uniref:helix-turn-helix domain-containing protein n=1 Tax=Streptomyces sp. NPDC051658 TaxID=3365667 RepID=UPI0037AFB24B
MKRAAREWVRPEAVGLFEGGAKNREIAVALRVSERSVERWRRQWRERGREGVRSKCSPGRPRLSSCQMAGSEREVACGGSHAWDRPDQDGAGEPVGAGAVHGRCGGCHGALFTPSR